MSSARVCNCPQNTPDPACPQAESSRQSGQQQNTLDVGRYWAGIVVLRPRDCWRNVDVGGNWRGKLACSGRSGTEQLGCAGSGTWVFYSVIFPFPSDNSHVHAHASTVFYGSIPHFCAVDCPHKRGILAQCRLFLQAAAYSGSRNLKIFQGHGLTMLFNQCSILLRKCVCHLQIVLVYIRSEAQSGASPWPFCGLTSIRPPMHTHV